MYRKCYVRQWFEIEARQGLEIHKTNKEIQPQLDVCKPLIEGVSSFKVDLLVSVFVGGDQSLVKVKLWSRLRSLFLSWDRKGHLRS